MPRGIYYGGLKKPEGPKSDWFMDCHKYVKFLLKDKDSIIRIAALRDHPDEIKGYAIITKHIDKTRIEFVYVKDHYRKEGIAKLLLKGFDIFNVNERHLTKVGAAILVKNGEKQMKLEEHNGEPKKANGDGDPGSQGDLPSAG